MVNDWAQRVKYRTNTKLFLQIFLQYNNNIILISLLLTEPQEPDNDDQPVGGAVLAGLQAQVGPGGVRRGEAAPRAQ